MRRGGFLNKMNSIDKKHLSPHFIIYNFTRSGEAYYRPYIDRMPNAGQMKNMEALCTYVLEPLWQHFGPIVIARGFMGRQVAYFNKEPYDSPHCRGEAADIVCGSRERGHFMYNFVKRNCEFDELRFEPSADNPRWLHVSYRVKGKNRFNFN